MGEVFCKEITKNNRDYVTQCAKKYFIEKSFEKKNRIFLHKESEFHSVKRIMEKFKDYSNIEFDTIFKLYKLQNYKIDVDYFKGTQYKYQTLVNLKSQIKSSTIDDSVYSKNITQRLINDFIKEIKSFSAPFSKNLITGKRVRDLLKSGCLNKEEIDFINSEITPTHIRKNKKMEEKNMTTMSETQKIYELIVTNYQKGSDYLATLLPSMNKKTLTTYIGYLKGFDKDSNRKYSTCPTTLMSLWKKYHYSNTVVGSLEENKKDIVMRDERGTTMGEEKEIVTKQLKLSRKYQEDKRKMKPTNQDLQFLVDNYKKGTKYLLKHLRNMKKRTIETYATRLRGLDRNPADAVQKSRCSNNLYKLWLSSKPGIPLEEFKDKREIEEVKENITQLDIVKNSSYILVFNGKIIKEDDSLDFLKGYMEAYKEANNSESIKIYQSVD